MVASTRLGFVVPSMNFIIEPDVYTILPKTVSGHFSRVFITEKSLDAEGYRRLWDQSNVHLERAMQELATARVASIAYAVTGGSFYGGRAWCERYRADNARALSTAITSTAYGIVEAIRAFGAKRVAVATAYLDHQNQNLAKYLREYGSVITALDGLGAQRVQEPASMRDDDVVALAKRVDSADADCVLVSCAGLSILHLIEPLEAALKKPVIASNQAVVWSSMRAAGLTESVKGFGSLFSH